MGHVINIDQSQSENFRNKKSAPKSAKIGREGEIQKFSLFDWSIMIA